MYCLLWPGAVLGIEIQKRIRWDHCFQESQSTLVEEKTCQHTIPKQHDLYFRKRHTVLWNADEERFGSAASGPEGFIKKDF